MSSNQQLQHLYWRAGFGPRPQDVAAGLSPRQALRQLLHDSQQGEPLIIPGLNAAIGDEQMIIESATGQRVASGELPTKPNAARPPRLRRAALTPEQRKRQNTDLREAYANLSTAWMERMAASPAQLREKMTLFWHGHFACRVRQPAAALSLHNTMHRHALDKFPDLLLAVSREPAMLQFLNNQQNRKARPNENFAREVMELFTLGRGNYTEQDVKEAARAFTGWGYDGENNFVFRERTHDAGPKTILGHTGAFTGEEVLQLLLQQPAAATFLVTKIYRFFVNEVPNDRHIAPLAAAFRHSGYDIADLMERLFLADWFYEPANVGTHIKSPVELLAGIRRTLGLQLENARPLLGYQKALGQTLFQPPNVAGWPGGRSWIDSSSLLLRLQLPAVLFRQAEFAVALKQDENDLAPNLGRAERTLRPGVGAQLPLTALRPVLAPIPAAQQPARLSEFLLQAPIRPENLLAAQQAAAGQAPADALRSLLLSLLSLPEYQLS
ncbi:DUF1800 domain-containing protein [Hymenobacter sp. BT683]|uniref:DUF1800 domain-containing protein n=1 Tax=Hymenobacter jeongseonensis TaxID=2791027 RepID=A0ABS0IJK1_9BACT|nr:DUF1800 domain-containing protein [Hymenobacter jeongseonensis]MBF9238526.1 DUF1800 domain-containing protein [Hymenobacter jeongseonensis]